MALHIPEVVAAVILQDGNVWLFDHDVDGREKRPFILPNLRHDSASALDAMNAYLHEVHGLTGITPVEIERRMVTSDDNKPVMYFTGLIYRVTGEMEPKPVDGIVLHKVTLKKLELYSMSPLHRRIIEQAFEEDASSEGEQT